MKLLAEQALHGGMPIWKPLPNRLLTATAFENFFLRVKLSRISQRVLAAFTAAEVLTRLPLLENSDDFSRLD